MQHALADASIDVGREMAQEREDGEQRGQVVTCNFLWARFIPVEGTCKPFRVQPELSLLPYNTFRSDEKRP